MTPNGIINQAHFVLTSLSVFLTNLDYFQFQRGGFELIAYSDPGHPVMNYWSPYGPADLVSARIRKTLV
jgi:hypothetical protein